MGKLKSFPIKAVFSSLAILIIKASSRFKINARKPIMYSLCKLYGLTRHCLKRLGITLVRQSSSSKLTEKSNVIRKCKSGQHQNVKSTIKCSLVHLRKVAKIRLVLILKTKISLQILQQIRYSLRKCRYNPRYNIQITGTNFCHRPSGFKIA